MSSNIDPTKPTDVTAYVQDVRDNFAAAKAEIESLQASIINIIDVSLDSWLTPSQITDARAGTTSFAADVPLQAAIDYCTGLASYSDQYSRVRLHVPEGLYQITAQVLVKTGVELVCKGTIKNNLVSSVTAGLLFKVGSHCSLLSFNCNSKGGVQFGENGLVAKMSVGVVRIWNGGTSAGQFNARFVGENFYVDDLNSEQGLIGIDIGDNAGNYVKRFICNRLRVYDSQTGLRISASSNFLRVGRYVSDSNHVAGASIDACHDVGIDMEAFYVDAVAGAVYSGGVANVGANSGGEKIEFLHMRLKAINTGSGAAVLQVANIKHSDIYTHASRGTLSTGNANNINTAITYGSNVDASLSMFCQHDAAITKYSGTAAGRLESWGDATQTFIHPIAAPSIALGVGTLRGEKYATKASDQSLTTQTTLQNDADLLFPIAVNEEWIVEFYLDVGAALSTTGIKVGITTPSGATLSVRAVLVPDVYAASNFGALRTNTSGTALDFLTAKNAGVSNAMVRVNVRVVADGTHAGNVQLQFAQSTSSGTATTVRAGSYMKASRVA